MTTAKKTIPNNGKTIFGSLMFIGDNKIEIEVSIEPWLRERIVYGVYSVYTQYRQIVYAVYRAQIKGTVLSMVSIDTV